jgi:chromosome segregation ATPase
MRQALGLHDGPSSQPPPNPTLTMPNGLHPQRRRFVRDGEVPVTIIHRDQHQDGASAGNQLDAARQALRSETTLKERAERLLEEAQATIRDLQTKLAHERLARDEAVNRLETQLQTVRQSVQPLEAELVAERQARRDAEGALAAARQQARGQAAGSTAHEAPKPGRKKRAARAEEPANADDDQSDVVEWWVPGWREKFR